LTFSGVRDKQQSAYSQTKLFLQPDEREIGLKMIPEHPETPLLQLNGDRGFVFCGPGKAHGKRYGIRTWG